MDIKESSWRSKGMTTSWNSAAYAATDLVCSSLPSLSRAFCFRLRSEYMASRAFLNASKSLRYGWPESWRIRLAHFLDVPVRYEMTNKTFFSGARYATGHMVNVRRHCEMKVLYSESFPLNSVGLFTFGSAAGATATGEGPEAIGGGTEAP